MNQSNFLRILLLFWLGILSTPIPAAANTFHQILLEKRQLEKQFDIETLECFPFIKEIGFTEDQIPLIAQCLQGTRTLKEALTNSSNFSYKTIGISNRFLATAGFHTALIPWNASIEEVKVFISNQKSHEEQLAFLNKIRSIKKKIAKNLKIIDFYCSKEISNEHCLKGYENLALVTIPKIRKVKRWRKLVITQTHTTPDSPGQLVLDFKFSPDQMKKHILNDPYQTWKPRKKMYERIQENFGSTFKNKLQMENLICDVNISIEECEQGAKSIAEASKSTDFRMRHWGKVVINRHNTIIQGDFHALIRYDLSPEEIIEYFSRKAVKSKATKMAARATKLEGRTKNNSTQLRAVCDLENLKSSQCVNGFETFIRFVKKNRDYEAQLPWDTVMFVDGTQLNRINFALNSSSRNTYLYVDANGSDADFAEHLNLFKRK